MTSDVFEVVLGSGFLSLEQGIMLSQTSKGVWRSVHREGVWWEQWFVSRFGVEWLEASSLVYPDGFRTRHKLIWEMGNTKGFDMQMLAFIALNRTDV